MKIQVELDAHGYFVRFLNFTPTTLYAAIKKHPDLKAYDRVKVLEYDGDINNLNSLYRATADGKLVFDVYKHRAIKDKEEMLANIKDMTEKLTSLTEYIEQQIGKTKTAQSILSERLEAIERAHAEEMLAQRVEELEKLVLDPLVPQR